MIDIESMDLPELEQLRNAINRRVLQLRRTDQMRLPELLQLFEEVKTTLQDQGKEWHSLERWQWMDGGIKFWLNPSEQDLYKPGWYTIDELISWAHNTGPVMIEEFEDEGPDPFALPSEPNIAFTWLPKSRETTDRKSNLV